MAKKSFWSILFFALCGLLAFFIQPGKSSNLLSLNNIEKTYGVLKEQRLFDQELPDPNFEVNDYSATFFLAADSTLVFDLGKAQDIGYVQLVSKFASFDVSISNDQVSFQPLQFLTKEQKKGLFYYTNFNTPVSARYIRVTLKSAVQRGALYELLVLTKQPEIIPVNFPIKTLPTYDSTREYELSKVRKSRHIKIALCVGVLAMFTFRKKKLEGLNIWVYVVLFLIGIVGWTNFENRYGRLHAHEVSHHYLGAKYFKELGHRDLYRAVARNEIESGRGLLLDMVKMRDLYTNTNYPRGAGKQIGAQFHPLTRFSQDRWESFSKDMNYIRWTFRNDHHNTMLIDRGYNASPLYTTVFGTIFNWFEPTKEALSIAGAVDYLLIILGLGLIWWAFGPLPAAISALLIGLGEPWSVIWNGNSIGRYLWFVLFCSGFCLLKKKQLFWGAFLLCLAGCLVIFPFILLGFTCLYAVYGLVTRNKALWDTSLVWGTATGTLVGLILPFLAHSKDIYVKFVENILLHIEHDSANRIGLKVLFNRITFDTGYEFNEFTLLLFKILPVFLLLVYIFMFLKASPRFNHWVILPLTAIALFLFVPLDGYYHVYLVCLVPLCLNSSFRFCLLFVMLLLTNIAAEFLEYHQGYSLSLYSLCGFFLLFYISIFMDLQKQKPLDMHPGA